MLGHEDIGASERRSIETMIARTTITHHDQGGSKVRWDLFVPCGEVLRVYLRMVPGYSRWASDTRDSVGCFVDPHECVAGLAKHANDVGEDREFVFERYTHIGLV